MDTTFQYNILPPEYNADIADVDFFKDTVWTGYVAGDNTSGDGSATIVSGSQVDVNSNYTAQVVLNKGSEMEVRGNEVQLPIGQFKIVADDDGTTPMEGAVTDGAARVRLQLAVNKNNQASFPNLVWRIVDPEMTDSQVGAGTLIDGSGNATAALPVDFNSEGISEAVYQAPDTFVRWGTSHETADKDIPIRYIQPTLDIAYYLLTGIGVLPPIKLKRPPVVLVHGLWGCGIRKGCGVNNEVKFSWKEFEDNFNKNSLYDIIPVDYSNTNADSFSINSDFVQSRGIDKAIGNGKQQGCAAQKVDLIGNSMGGLLPRQYCMTNPDYCKDHIRKFITTDTPHLGSELANLIQITNLTPTSGCYNFLLRVDEQGKSIWSDPQHTILRGALIDLSKGSPALSNLANFSFKAIVGSALSNVLAYDISLKNMWIGLVYYCGYQPDMSYELPAPPYVATPMFSEDNDRIVSISSQQGSSVEHYRIFGVDHLTVLGNPQTATKISEWLDKP